jgi:L-asparaginase
VIFQTYLKKKMPMNQKQTSQQQQIQPAAPRRRVLVIKALFGQEDIENRDTLQTIEEDLREGTTIRHAPVFDTREEYAMRNYFGRPSEANELSRIITENYDKYDGFVVLRTVSNMPYVASLLSFSLEHLNKCVCFTGCDVPHNVAHSELRRNYTLALLVAGSENLRVREVCIVFADQVLRATRTVLNASWGETQLFSSPFLPPLATVVGSTVLLGTENTTRSNNTNEIFPQTSSLPTLPTTRLIPHFMHTVRQTEIFHLIVTPSMHEPTIMRLASLSKAKGVIVYAYGSGTIPTTNRATIRAVQEFYKRGAAVIVVTQVRFGATSLDDYGASLDLARYAVASGDMTSDCATAKLRYYLSIGKPREEIYRDWTNSIRGEVSSTAKRSHL